MYPPDNPPRPSPLKKKKLVLPEHLAVLISTFKPISIKQKNKRESEICFVKVEQSQNLDISLIVRPQSQTSGVAGQVFSSSNNIFVLKKY